MGEHTLWEGLASLQPFVATSRAQVATFKLESASRQQSFLRDTFKFPTDVEQSFEDYMDSVNAFISVPSRGGNVITDIDRSEFLIDSKTAPLLNVGWTNFEGDIYQFLEQAQKYAGGWAYERRDGKFGLRSFYAATGQEPKVRLTLAILLLTM